MPRQFISFAAAAREEIERLGPTFCRAYALDETPCFGDLLQAMEVSDRRVPQERDQLQGAPSDIIPPPIID